MLRFILPTFQLYFSKPTRVAMKIRARLAFHSVTPAPCIRSRTLDIPRIAHCSWITDNGCQSVQNDKLFEYRIFIKSLITGTLLYNLKCMKNSYLSLSLSNFRQEMTSTPVILQADYRDRKRSEMFAALCRDLFQLISPRFTQITAPCAVAHGAAVDTYVRYTETWGKERT